jgi:hypothetical protein
MPVEQISVFLENKPGRLAGVTKVLMEAAINIRALSLADTSDFGVVRLIVNDTGKAIQALQTAGFRVRRTEVVAIELDDRPGGLHEVLEILRKAGINVEYVYAFVRPPGGRAVIILRFDDPAKAIQTLAREKITILDGDRLYGI